MILVLVHELRDLNKIFIYLGMLCRESGIYVRCPLQYGMPSRKSKYSEVFFVLAYNIYVRVLSILYELL